MVKVYDGKSLNAPLIEIDGSSSSVLSRLNTVVIVYDKTALSSIDAISNVSLHVNYSTYSKCVCVCVPVVSVNVRARACVCMSVCMTTACLCFEARVNMTR